MKNFKEEFNVNYDFRFLIENLIWKQFAHPALDSVREIIANGQDANARAGRAEEPVIVTIKGKCLSVRDKGDGIRNIGNFFVPGRSANLDTLFDVQKGMSNVTGRFGQGALSIVYDLYADNSLSNLVVPQISKENGSLNFIFRCRVKDFAETDNSIFELKFTAKESTDSPTFSHEMRFLTKKDIPRMSILSGQENSAIKIKCWKGENDVFVDVAERSQEIIGTELKIYSSVIEKNCKEICSYITDVFKSCKFPVILNGLPVEEPPSRKLPFLGGTLAFTPVDDKNQVDGTLRLCECGKLIVKFKLSPNYLVPFETTINFDRLGLTQDRGSLDYCLEQTRIEMCDLIDVVFQSEYLTCNERSALLNAFHPITDAGHFNLTQKIQMAFSSLSIEENVKPETTEALPIDTEEPSHIKKEDSEPIDKEVVAIKNEEAPIREIDYASMNPGYFGLLPLNEFFRGRGYKLYIDNKREQPSVVFAEGEYHIFLNKNWLPLDQEIICAYNLLVLNRWMDSHAFLVSIDIRSFCLDKFGKLVPLIAENEMSEELPPPPSDDEFNPEEYIVKKENMIYLETQEERLIYLIDNFPKFAYPNDAKLEGGLRGYLLKTYSDLAKLGQDRHKLNDEDIHHYMKTKYAIDQPKLQKLFFALYCFNTPGNMKYLCDAFFSGKQCFAHIPDINHPIFLHIFNGLVQEEEAPTIHAVIWALHVFLQNKTEDEQEIILSFFCRYSYNSLQDFEQKRRIYNKLQQIVKAANCNNPGTVKQFFESVSSQIGNIDQIRTTAEYVAYTSAVPYFMEKLDVLSNWNQLLTWPKQQLVRFLEIFPNIDFEVTERDYENMLSLCLRKNVPKALLTKLVSIYGYGASISTRAGLSSTGYLLRMINSYINKNTLPSLDALEAIEKEMKSCYSLIASSYRKIRFCQKRINDEKEKAKNPYSHEQLINNVADTYPENTRYLPFKTYSVHKNIEKVIELDNLIANDNPLAITAFFRKEWDENGMFTLTTRPFLFALLFNENGSLLSDNFKWLWQLDDSALFLHQDPDLIAFFGSEDIAQRRIHGATVQTVEDYFFLRELLKNSKEALATEMALEVHCDEENNTIVVIRDNGCGMDNDGLNALKIPNKTSKNVSEDEKSDDIENTDGNFGWGFFTQFRLSKETVVITKKNGEEARCIAFKKTSDGILRQYLPVEDTEQAPIQTGTSITLKIKSDPLLSLIKIEAELTSLSKYVDHIDIRFQGKLLSKKDQIKPLKEASSEGLRVELGEGETGIFCKGILMGPLTNQYAEFLPEPLQQFLQDHNLRFRLFLPHSKQVMNRNNLIESKSTLLLANRLITRLALEYCVEQLGKKSEGDEDKDKAKNRTKTFKIIPENYWSKFRTGFSIDPSKSIVDIIQCLSNEQPQRVSTDPELKLPRMLVDYAQNLMVGLKKNNNIPLEIDKQVAEFGSIFTTLEKGKIEEKQTSNLQRLKQLSRSRMFAGFIMHYPLNDQGETFMTIRKKYKKNLISQNVILASGDYNRGYLLKLNEIELKNILENLSNQVKGSCGPESENIIEEMKNKILNRCNILKKESFSLQANETQWQEIRLEAFFKQIASILGKNVGIQFYSDADGAVAYTLRGINIIFINRRCLVEQFAMLCSATKKLDIENPIFLELLIEMIDTIAHEVVHLEESSECGVTHDLQFYQQLAEKLQQLFISKDSEMKTLAQLCEKLLV